MIEPREVIQELEEIRTTYEDDTELHEWLGIAIDTINELMADLCSCYQLVSIQQIRADIKNIKMSKMTNTKTTHKPKTKHKSEAQKVADQRKKQIAEAQKKAKAGLQDSLELNSRLDPEPIDLDTLDIDI
jgi:hypothetical protein